eukprot:6159955-Pyramimonas_sp.AAC.1
MQSCDICARSCTSFPEQVSQQTTLVLHRLSPDRCCRKHSPVGVRPGVSARTLLLKCPPGKGKTT